MKTINRVCHLSSVHPAFDTRIFFKECRSLAEAGYDVSLIAVTESETTVDGVHIIPFIRYRNRLKRILLSPFKMFRMARMQRADIYHFHDPELLITGMLLTLFTRSKVVYDIHEDYSKNFLDKPWIKFKWARVMASKVFYFIEKTVSRVMSGNVVVLPHWVEKYPKSVLVRNYPVPEKQEKAKDCTSFVYVGTLGSKRSAVEMCRVFEEVAKRVRNVTFEIIGIFMEKAVEAEVKEIISRCPSIHYVGYRPFNEARLVLERAGYGFVLYKDIKYKENIPAKMYEYLASGVIPIFSSFDDFKYEVESEGWGIGINPVDPVSAAEKIVDIMAHEEKKKVIEERMNFYRSKYSWESEKMELLKLYKSI